MKTAYLFVLALLLAGVVSALKKPMGFPWSKVKESRQATN